MNNNTCDTLNLPETLEEAHSIIIRIIPRLIRARAQKATVFKDKEINIILEIIQKRNSNDKTV